MKMKLFAILAAILAITVMLSACMPAHTDTEDAMGALLLSLNPEIEIEYDEDGLVIELEGKNDDGKEVLLTYKDFEGKSVKQVITELVEAIFASGKYDLELKGNDKNIVVKLEKGSAYPNEQFLEEVAQAVREAVAQQGKKSETVVVEEKDLNENGLIGLEKAKELVLAQLGIADADFIKKEYDLDDGVYELEFIANGMEYEYEVDARTGKILEADAERNDDWHVDIPANPVKPAISLEEAKAAAFKHLGIKESDISRPEYELDDGKYELSFHVGKTEYDVDVDATTGKILKVEKEVDGREEEVIVTKPAISLEEAKAAAFKHLGIKESDISRPEYELDGNKYELSFHVGRMEYEVDVDATTGKILKVEKEIDD